MKRALIVLLFIGFLLFAALQYNDPDPLLWIFIYAYIAVLCLFAALNQYNKRLLLISGSIYFIGFLYLLPKDTILITEPTLIFSQAMTASNPMIEEAREALGLLLSSACLFYLFKLSGNYSNKKVTTEY